MHVSKDIAKEHKAEIVNDFVGVYVGVCDESYVLGRVLKVHMTTTSLWLVVFIVSPIQ